MGDPARRLDRDACARGFIQAAQYLAGALATADVLDESRELIRSAFAPDLVAFCAAPGTEGYTPPDALEAEAARRAARQVIETGLVALETAAGEPPLACAALPVNVRGQTEAALLVGYAGERALPQHLLEALLGVVGLVGAALERQRADRELRASLEALRDANAELARSNRELEQFAYVASHDLQEPLRMVSSYLQLLARRYRGKLDEDGEEFMRFALDGARRGQQLINDLLAFSRVGTRRRELRPTDCERVLEAALQSLEVAARESGATISHGPLPTVMGDGPQLSLVLQNLVGNALKFRGPDLPRVNVTAERQGGEWVLAVEDNGLGIAPEYFDRIFLIFQRLHTREEYPGTGIGLAIAKRIVERHGGRIWVESAPGRGSTFRFSIPACDDGMGGSS